MEPLKLMCGKLLRGLRRREENEGRKSCQISVKNIYGESLSKITGPPISTNQGELWGKISFPLKSIDFIDW